MRRPANLVTDPAEAPAANSSDTPFLIIVALVAAVELGGSAIIAAWLIASLP